MSSQVPDLSLAECQEAFRKHARYTLGANPDRLTSRQNLLSVSLAVRDRLVDGMLATEDRYQQADAKRLYYLSMEFLMGRSLGNNLINLELFDTFKASLEGLGVDLEEVREQEVDAALGNGGLGRLAACFLDSLATLNLPGFGYGINYEYGLFKQEIKNGYQHEKPDNWQVGGSPWQIAKPDEACLVPVYGAVDHAADRDNNYNPMWLDWKVIVGIPHDMPIVGYGGNTVNYLRLYSAVSCNDFDMEVFNQGDYLKAVEQRIASETISKVLYPEDSFEAGRELRLIQEYFLVACAVRDIVTRYKLQHGDFSRFSAKVAIQLNDTHPALTVVELMRVLIDENSLAWDEAWQITQATLGYTNHTLLPEALEKWSVALFEKVLPRHLQIINEINNRFLAEVEQRWPGDAARQHGMSIIQEGADRQVRMGHLSIVGSHSVNGVAALHSELVKTSLVPDFHALWPEKFNNKTNGVTQRRWLLKANPKLAGLISDTIGSRWITNLDRLHDLEPFADHADFQQKFYGIKRANKETLAKVIKETTSIRVDPASLFDVQVKRMHEYKRQLLNVLQIVHEYLRLIEDDQPVFVPRTYIFAGKAAPGYWAAKQIIKLINNLGRVINADRRVNNLLKVVFIPDYRVSLAEKIIPAADLSEQISTAGKEASGTGNMKFAMNGALTIGTLDGANIEIMEEVGAENIFIFGLQTEEIEQMVRSGSYNPRTHYEQNNQVKRVLDALQSNLFCRDEPGLFQGIFDSLLQRDEYFHLADLPAYIKAQAEVGKSFCNQPAWQRKAILNVARIGKFSSDRTIREYAEQIWDLKAIGEERR
jgi:starch phosphorylase